MKPAKDIFTRASELVSSLVVVPLLANDPSSGALGAIYFALDSPCDFDNIQDALLVCGGMYMSDHGIYLKSLGGCLGFWGSIVQRRRGRGSVTEFLGLGGWFCWESLGGCLGFGGALGNGAVGEGPCQGFLGFAGWYPCEGTCVICTGLPVRTGHRTQCQGVGVAW